MSLSNFEVRAQDQSAVSKGELAMKMANPIADLVSLPLQNHFEFGIGLDDGFRYFLNMQPVIPISLNENWIMISRSIIPVIFQDGVTAGGETEFGLGDISQSLFFSPKKLKENGLIWGVGPAFLLPTATQDLGGKKWAAGPNLVLLKIKGPWTFGTLVNHFWSFAGSGDSDINDTFFQPWITFSTPDGVSYSVEAENTQSWDYDIFTG